MAATVTFGKPIPFSEKDDVSRLLSKSCFDFGYHKATKIFNVVYLIFITFLSISHIIFLINNATTDFVARYASGIALHYYAVTVSTISMILEKRILKLRTDLFNGSWSTRNISFEGRKHIQKYSVLLNGYVYWIFFLGALCSIFAQPVFGSLSEFYLLEIVSEEYYGIMAPFVNWYYCLTYPFLVFTAVRLCFLVLYVNVSISVQIHILNQYILNISNDGSGIDKNPRKRDDYQKEIYRRLTMCSKQHIALNKLIAYFLEMINLTVPVMLLMGVVSSMAVIFFVVTTLLSTSTMTKIRIGLVVLANVFVLSGFCVSGQLLVDETSTMFDTLMMSPWENWDKGNRQFLQIFMANCLKPKVIQFAEIVLDYKCGLTMVRIAYSYALVFYRMNNGF